MTKTTVLLTPEEVDAAAQKSVGYRAARQLALHALRQPPLLLQLLEVRGQRQAGEVAQLGRGVRPRRVEQLVAACAGPRRAPSSRRRSRSRRCATYSSSFAAGSHTYGPWPGHSTSSGSARSRRSDSRYADSEPSPGAMNTLPLPSTVSPVKQTRSRHSRQTLSAECPGVAIALNGPAALPLARALDGDAEQVGRPRRGRRARA